MEIIKLEGKRNLIHIVIDIILLILLFVFIIYSYNAVRPHIYNPDGIEIVANGNGFETNIDGVSKTNKGGKEYIEIKGWIIQQENDSKKNSKMKLLLKNCTTGEYILLPTKSEIRKDITKLKYDGSNYDFSGFRSQSYLNSFFDTDNFKYEIFVLYETPSKKSLVESGYLLNSYIVDKGDK